MGDETDHDILIELRTDVKHLINAHEELKGEFHRECMPRIEAVERQQNRWIGRDGAIAIVVSTGISVGSFVLAVWSGLVGGK